MFERFTDRARRVVVLAQEEARLLDHEEIGTEHLLLGLIHEGDGVAARALEVCGVTLEEVRRVVASINVASPVTPSGHIPFSDAAKRSLELSLREALSLDNEYIGTEHILLGVLAEHGVAARILSAMRVDSTSVRAVVMELLEGGTPEPTPRAVRPTVPFDPRRRGIQRADFTGEHGPRPAGCTFCGVPSPQCGGLFVGNGDALICEQCARSIVAKLPPAGSPRVWPAEPVPAALSIDDVVAAVVATGPPPDDEDTARVEIEAAVLNLTERTADGRGLANVENGDDLGRFGEEAERRRPSSVQVVTVVDAIAFVSATEASAWSTTVADGRPVGGLFRRENRLVLVDGRWMVTRSSASEWFAVAGIWIPSRDDASPDA